MGYAANIQHISKKDSNFRALYLAKFKRMNLYNNAMKTLLNITCCVFLLTKLAGQTVAENNSAVSLFSTLKNSGILAIKIKTDQRKFIREKKKEIYQPAHLFFKDAKGEELAYEIQMKSRGNMRLKTCYYPPIRIKLTDSTLQENNLQNYPKLKLVVGCKGGESYEKLLLKEYLAYKINNIITENSFRVQLLELTMQDTEGKNEDRVSYAFAIEDQDEMAERLGGILFEPRSVSRRALQRASYDVLALFQYIIGNTDWFVLNKHNTKYVRTEEPPAIIPIAYDFDFAGMVNAPYAVPNEKIPISSVTQRYFIGECRDEGGYAETIRKLLDKKLEILKLVEDFTHLNERSRQNLIKYLNESFEILEDPKKQQKELAKGCGWSPLDN